MIQLNTLLHQMWKVSILRMTQKKLIQLLVNMYLPSISLLDIQMNLMNFAFIGVYLVRKKVLGVLQTKLSILQPLNNGVMDWLVRLL